MRRRRVEGFGGEARNGKFALSEDSHVARLPRFAQPQTFVPAFTNRHPPLTPPSRTSFKMAPKTSKKHAADNINSKLQLVLLVSCHSARAEGEDGRSTLQSEHQA